MGEEEIGQYSKEEETLKRQSAEEEIIKAKLNCEMEQAQIRGHFGLIPQLCHDKYAELGIRKVNNGFIITFSMETYVFSDLEAVIGYIRGLYK